jgi:hypothetical protein
MADIGDMVTVKKTGLPGKVVRKEEVFGKIKYKVEQLNGKDVDVTPSEIEE